VTDAPLTFPVEAGAILCFARAVGDPNPAYAAPGAPAPPTFTQASAQWGPANEYRPRPGEPWMGSGATPSGTGGRLPGDGGAPVLHAEQSYEYHRPLVAGDVLTVVTVPGATWEKAGRSGRLAFTETITEYRGADGEPVVTARSVAVVATPAPADATAGAEGAS
jgi:hypothetical protein